MIWIGALERRKQAGKYITIPKLKYYILKAKAMCGEVIRVFIGGTIPLGMFIRNIWREITILLLTSVFMSDFVLCSLLH